MRNSGELDSSSKDPPAPAHNPLAPAHESFNISTTVDPCFVISLIRKLVPLDVKDCKKVHVSCLHGETSESEGVSEIGILLPENGEVEAKEIADNGGEEIGHKTINEKQHQGRLAQEKTWEECGCILWDLSASQNHARLMAQNLIVDVLLANLMVSQSARSTEIILGIIGNLACHEISRKQISSSNGLVKVIVDHFFLDDVPSLCEAFRMITTFLQYKESVVWAEALQTEQTLSRILWISENALNRKLIKKITCFLFWVINEDKTAIILLPPMMKLGLSSVLINLLASETSIYREEQKPEGDAVLDYILLSLEKLSDMDDYSEEICFNKQLLQPLVELVKFPDKFEIPNGCVTASTLLAKIVIDGTNLASEMSQDLDVLRGIMDAFPFADGHLLTQASMWNFIALLLTKVQESGMSTSFLNRLVSIFSRKFDLLREEIDLHFVYLLDDEYPPDTAYMDTLVNVLKRVCCIFTQWKLLDDETKNTASKEGDYVNDKDVDKLLDTLAYVFIESCVSCEEPPPPADHPSVSLPPHKSLGISTKVDPCFEMSSTRRAVPSDVKDGENARENDLLEVERESGGIEKNANGEFENKKVEPKETVSNCVKGNGP